MTQRFEGKNLDDALQQAAATLGAERHQLTHRVLVEKRGFLGGVKRVVIEAEVNPEAPPPPAAAVTPPAPAATSGPPVAPRESRGGGGGGGRERGGRGGRDRGGRRDAERRPQARRGRGRREESTLQTGDFEHFANEIEVEIPDQDPQSDGAKLVRDWIEEVLELAKLSLTVRTSENDEQILVKLYGRDAGRVTAEHGEVLDALQVLANKALTGRKVEKDIELDCQDFKERRTTDIGQQAREAADRVRRDKREELLPAMSPIERRIVHLTLQDDAEVTTESRGEGFYKRVAIIPRA